MGTETENKKNMGVKGGISALTASFDVLSITTLVVWGVGLYLVFKLTTLKGFVSSETYLIALLFATVLLYLMIAISNQTTIVHTLKRMEERMKNM